MATRKQETTIEVPALEREVLELYLVGVTPLLFNRMSEKARRELLLPRGRKTAADRKQELKHDPLEEYRASVYVAPEEAETYLALPSPAVKGALAQAAVDVPGATKAAIQRLVRVHGYRVPVWGVPQLFITGVRLQDRDRTPDIRTRAIVPRWACRVEISYVRPLLNQRAVVNLLAAAGEIVGVGDFRQEKGRGDFGLFRVAGPDDQEFLEIVGSGGKEEQVRAMKDPEPYDAETAELLDWFIEERDRRGL
jgi:hypothetical protein